MRSIPMIATLVISLAGCGVGTQPGDVQMALTGADGLQLFTATSNNTPGGNPHHIVSAVVTVKEIDALSKGKWIPIMTTPESIDLLTLDHKTLNTLGIAQLPKTSKVSELRMKLDQKGAYVVLADGSKHTLDVPGTVKIEGKIELDDCSAGTVIVDFDPRIRVEEDCHHKVDYDLACVAHIKTSEVKNACNGGGSAGMGGGGAGGGGMGGAGGAGGTGGSGGSGMQCAKVCQTYELCDAGSCVADPRCNGVTCLGTKVCSAGACIADPCLGVTCTGTLMCTAGVCQ